MSWSTVYLIALTSTRILGIGSAPTPAPNFYGPIEECPADLTPPSLEVIFRHQYNIDYDDPGYLRVLEPGGKEATWPEIGDVGASLSHSNIYYDYLQYQAYVLFNGLSVDTDPVLGDYVVWIDRGTANGNYKMTARSNGELLWVEEGFLNSEGESPRYAVTVNEYTESDCSIDVFGSCSYDSLYSSTGRAPCEKCPPGEVAYNGDTFCTIEGIREIEVSEIITEVMVADAVGGFAGPGRVEFDNISTDETIVLGKDDVGTLQLSGKFVRDDAAALPTSIALFLYIDNEDAPNDFVRGQGEIDASTGVFTAVITDVPLKFSKTVLSFVVLDPAEAFEEQGATTAVTVEVLNTGCSEALSIALEWDTADEQLDLYVIEPGGTAVYDDNPRGDVGNLDVDDLTGAGPETYVVYSGQSGDAMLGEYTAFVRPVNTILTRDEWTLRSATAWTLTATVNGDVVWVEKGFFAGPTTSSSSFSYTFEDFSEDDIAAMDNDGDSTSRRALATTYFSESSIGYSTLDSDHFTVALTDYIDVLCY